VILRFTARREKDLDQPAFAEAEETGVIGMSGQADDEVILEPQAEQAA
jgi:hypothetical protein